MKAEACLNDLVVLLILNCDKVQDALQERYAVLLSMWQTRKHPGQTIKGTFLPTCAMLHARAPVSAYLEDVQENGVQDNLWQEIRGTCSCCYTPVYDPVVQWPEHNDHSNTLSIHYPS